jgi:hypothetical protein
MMNARGFCGSFLVWWVTALCAGCSSSSGGGGGDQSVVATGLPADSTPTAPLTASQSSATALVAEIQEGATELVQAADRPTDLPMGVDTLPTGVVETLQCSSLGTAGSGSITINENGGSTPAAGTNVSITYDQCTFSSAGTTVTYNGSVTEEYVSYASASDFELAIEANNFSFTISSGSGVATESEKITYSYTIDVSNGVETISYTASNGGSLVITASDVVTKGTDETITQGTYVYKSSAGGGVVQAIYDNWTYDSSTGFAISGSVTVKGSGGAQVVLTASATNYTVVYTSAAGVVTSYTVSH